MKATRLLAIICIESLIFVSAALGDGGMFIRRPDPVDVLQPTQKVYIRWDGSEERLLIQTKYEGPAEEMVWIVPVPSEPNVEMADGAVFEKLSDETEWPDISYTSFGGYRTWMRPSDIVSLLGSSASGGWSAGGGGTPVEWHRRIGSYDVVLLRPVGEATVVNWLTTNGYAVPDKAVPVLEDYIREQWWMVVAKIHPDALTDITQEKLAQGLLHPLEMTFQSSSCLYPMRLTSIAAGPVEELIYIEGPAHYEPVTLAEGDWEIGIFGGPDHHVTPYQYLSDVGLAVDAQQAAANTEPARHLTKLRRVFEPNEMTDDLVFGELDYGKWVKGNDALQVGEAATQYGRHRDPNGVAPLLDFLSSGILERHEMTPQEYQQWPSPSARLLPSSSYVQWQLYGPANGPQVNHVFCAIWAIGEIAVENAVGSEAEDMLLYCARHDNQLVRMEAYLALTKLRSEQLGPILAERLLYLPLQGARYILRDFYLSALAYEMDIVADWISLFGTTEQKDALVNALMGPTANLHGSASAGSFGPQKSEPTNSDWFEWIVWRAACTRDARLVAPLQGVYSALTFFEGAESTLGFIQRALAACGSTDAVEAVLGQIDADQAKFLVDGQAPTWEDMASLKAFYVSQAYLGVPDSLRVQVLRKHQVRYELYPMPSDAADEILRRALSEKNLSDWYNLYLLAGIKSPQPEDRDRLMRIWDAGDQWARLIATDVLYVWNDWQTLMSLYGRAEPSDVKSEIAWALADLGIAKAVAMVEEQVLTSWNPDWIARRSAFVLKQLPSPYLLDLATTDAVRKAESLWRYFHPKWEGVHIHHAWQGLDQGRLAVLKRLAGDNSIHPGARFEWLEIDYATQDWATPLLTSAIRETLETYPESSTVGAIISGASGVDVHFVVDACNQSTSDDFRRTLLNNLLASGSAAYLPVIEGLLWEVWPQRYIETEGQSILFREPGDLAASLDYYCEHAQRVTGRRGSATYTSRPMISVLQSIVQDDSLPAGYRAFLLIYWRTAPGWFSQEFVENLLTQDMPDYLREALEQRLLDWQYRL